MTPTVNAYTGAARSPAAPSAPPGARAAARGKSAPSPAEMKARPAAAAITVSGKAECCSRSMKNDATPPGVRRAMSSATEMGGNGKLAQNVCTTAAAASPLAAPTVPAAAPDLAAREGFGRPLMYTTVLSDPLQDRYRAYPGHPGRRNQTVWEDD